MSHPQTHLKPAVEIICVQFHSLEEFTALKQDEWFEDELKDTDCSGCEYAYQEIDNGYRECQAQQPTDCPSCPEDFEDEYIEIIEPLENVA